MLGGIIQRCDKVEDTAFSLFGFRYPKSAPTIDSVPSFFKSVNDITFTVF